MKSAEKFKSDIERIFSAAGFQPVHRTRIQGEEVFIADGFATPSLVDSGRLERFNISPGEFPFGCFLTMWCTEQYKGLASIAVFDAFHDAGYSPEEKRKMRIASVIKLAQQDFKRRKMH